ncbi:MAG: beta-ketoacyl synthase N-terminal-like domain-containing protein [bacterium]
MEGREVWITGAGMLTPLGRGVDATWEAIRAGRRGVVRHPQQEEAPFPENFLYFGAVDGHEDPPEFPPKLASQRKFLNRTSILGLHAAEMAVQDSGADLAALSPERKSLYVGSGDFTRIEYLDLYSSFAETAGPDWAPPDPEALNEMALHQVSPFYLLEGLANNLISFLSSQYEIMGTNGNISSLSSCGAQALEACDRALRWGEADLGIVVACGSWVSPLIRFELDGLGILSRARDGADSFRPFDRKRDGFFPAEGAAAFVIEAAEGARARGARAIGRILGTGNFQEVSSGYHISVPGESILRASRAAMKEAGVSLSGLSFILPHGSGTPKGDHLEMRALKNLLGGNGARLPLSGWKPYTGHMGSASDISEIILGLRAIEEGVLPPTPCFERSEKEFAGLDFAADERSVEGKVFLSLSHGLGGQSSATVVSAP